MNIKHLFKEIRYYKKLDGSLKRMGTKFVLAKTPLKKWVNSSSYNSIYNKKIKQHTKKIKPVFIQIENTNFCNAKCLMCPHGIMKRKKKTMSQHNFEKIIKNIVKDYSSIKTVIITGFGEPFMDIKLIQKIEFLNKQYPKLQIDIYTNASLLTKELIEKLLKTRLHKINLSINGTKRTYNKMMGLDYEKTLKNVLYLIKKKKELKKKSLLINVSLMIVKENEKEIEKFQNFWINKADSVMVYPPSNWAGKHKINFVTSNPFKQKRWPCGALWQFITVDVDGNVIMCCRDYESKVKFGNLLKKDVKEIFEKGEIKKIRERHLREDFDIPICKNCDNSFDSSLNWWN